MGKNTNILEIPVLVLKVNTVFPNMIIGFDISKKKSINAVKEAMLKDQLVFLCVQKNVDAQIPTESDIYKWGVIGKIKQSLNTNGEQMKIIFDPTHRGRIIELTDCIDYLYAKVEQYEDDSVSDVTTEAYVRSINHLLPKYLALRGLNAERLLKDISEMSDYSKYSDFVSGMLGLRNEISQKILEELDLNKRLELIHHSIVNEIEVLKVKRDISEKLQESAVEHEKKYFLRKQLEYIKNALNLNDVSDDVDDFMQKLQSLNLPENIHEKIEKEIARYANMNEHGSEISITGAYLKRVLELPWNEKSEESLHINYAKEILDRDHYGLDDVKKRILEFLAVRKISNNVKSPIICLVGPPGVGKTSIATSIAEAMNRKFVKISLGGVRDEAQIRGHIRTYVGAVPGRIMTGLENAKTKNPVFLLDEIDKLGDDYRGDPTSALLEVLDPNQNKDFTDHYFDVPFDLSDVMFIATANTIDELPRPLYDRLEIIEVSGYTPMEKFEIAKRYLIPKQMKEHGLNAKSLSIKADALRFIIDRYTRESGVRDLERHIAKLCRKTAKKLVDKIEENSESQFTASEGENHIREELKNAGKITISKAELFEYLGAEIPFDDLIPKKNEIGVANGLAWTSVGGETLRIEVALIPGSDKIELTGQMGEVMQESAKTGISYIKSQYRKFGLKKDFYKNVDIHIHIPEGAVPKDGPSAGITMALAVLSAFTGRKVDHTIAMTGEITLRGNVLAIGGLKEKALGASRDKIKTVLLPYTNEKDLEEIPKSVKEKMNFKCVKHFDEVVEIALLKK